MKRFFVRAILSLGVAIVMVSISIVIATLISTIVHASKADMLAYTVRLKYGTGTGSGVVVYSNGDTYIATANHVVEKSYQKLQAPDNKGLVTVYKDIEVQFFRYEGGRMKETILRTARVVASNKDMDIAILKLSSYSAPILNGLIATAPIGITPEVFDEVFSVGAGLTQVPFPTKGIVASLDGVSTAPRSSDPVFILHSAHVIWGFSGGGLFRFNPFSDKYELVGINVQVGIEVDFNGSVVLTFMSYAVKMDDVRKIGKKAGIPW